MLRDHLVAFATLAFAVLLLVLAVSEHPDSLLATGILGALALAALGVFLRVEHANRRSARRQP